MSVQDLENRIKTIAEQHIADHNPSMCKGMTEDDIDCGFSDCRATYRINHEFYVNVHFEFFEGDGWGHEVEIVQNLNETKGNVVDRITGYGIDSVLNLAESICYLYFLHSKEV